MTTKTTSKSFSDFKNISWPQYKHFHPSINQSTHLLLSNTHRSNKLKLIYGNRRYVMWTTSGNGQVPDMDSTCKYANNNLTTKTITDTAWVMVKHPINKEQHLMKCHRGAPYWIDFCNGNRKVWLTLSM